MAFGFGFNKQKVLSAAEKFVQQGKLQNAISEYEKVLKADPKDLTVLNTVGDLHSRLGEQDKAAECFKNVGDAYASQGFTVKAIAMYKKLSKLKTSMECVLRLAELYTQQGLFNDARAQYLQVAEDFLKTGQLDQAVRIFQKTLEMDPENVPMRTKLAEVYVRMGRKDEAWKLLTAAAESLKTKGQLAAADEILQRMLKLDPQSSYVLVLRGKAAVEAGDFGAAIDCLSKVADLDSNPEGLRALFHAYLRSKRFTDAGTLANKLANVHDDISAIAEYTEALVAAQQFNEALQVFDQFSDRLMRNNPEKLLENLRSMIGHVKDDPQALEIVLGLFGKSGETAHRTEIYELLAHANVQSGDLDKAREYYSKLMQLEPQNQLHARNYQQVLDKQGTSPTTRLITAEEGSVLVDELEATAPFIDQRYDDDVALAVRAALTDAELFISYNMPAKAMAPLIGALPKASRDLRINQKLAALYTRAEKFTEAAVSCRTLESIYHDAGHAEEASRYGDLASKYEERGSAGAAKALLQEAASAPEKSHAPSADFEVSAAVHEVHEEASELPVAAVAAETIPDVTSVPVAAVASAPMASGLFFHGAPPAVTASEPAPEFSVAPEASASTPETEIDLSSEWEQDLSVEAPQTIPEITQPIGQLAHAQEESSPATGPDARPVTLPNLDESTEEVRFYLGQGMTEQAEEVLAKLEAAFPDSPQLAVLRAGIDSAKGMTAQANGDAEVSLAEHAPEASAPVAQPWPSERPVLEELVSELEASLGDGFVGDAPSVNPAAVIPPAGIPENVGVDAHDAFRSGTLDEFVSDLEATLGSDFVPGAPVAQTVAAIPAPTVKISAPATSVHEKAPAALAASAAASSPSPLRAPTAVVGRSIAPPATSFAAPAPPLTEPQKFDLQAGVDLSEMFGELKHELEGGVANSDEDPETHYNLGVAFREMGLLDEAIGEFQKVCQSIEHGRAFPQMMQTYTWLAQCFLDKGVPEAAVRWYETALKLPSLDQETRTALHYELASSLQSAGNNPAALSNFLQVYGSNIDYRDVAERIKALRT
jgi:tetratricopeptide (TPR) repeat protein